MSFKQWVRDVFGPESRAERASRHGKSRRTAKRGFTPLVESLEDRRMLAVLTVTSLKDDTLANLAGDGKLELREAIQLATHPGTTIDGVSVDALDTDSTIRFASSIDGGTISLSTFISDGSVAGASAFRIDTGNTLTIDGETGLTGGITIERNSSAAAFRFFYVNPNADLTLKGLTLMGGTAKGGNGGSGDDVSTGGGGAGLGGAIFNRGRVTILDSTLSGNTAQGGAGGTRDFFYLFHNDYHSYESSNSSGGGGMTGDGVAPGHTYDPPGFTLGPANYGGAGGGPNGGGGGQNLYPSGKDGQFGGGGGGARSDSVSFLSIGATGGSGGFGGGGGGGGYAEYLVTSNGFAAGNGGFGGGGGGAVAGNGAGEVDGTPGAGGFGGGSGNQYLGGGGAGMGGAVFNLQGTVVITNSTIADNNAFGGAGGTNGGQLAVYNTDLVIFKRGFHPLTIRGNAGQGMGGGVFNFDGLVEVSSSTVAENYAPDGGGGIFSMDNGAGSPLASVFLNNSIVANSFLGTDHTVVSSSDLKILLRGGAVKVAGGFNLIGTSAFPTTGDVTNTMSDNLTGDPKLKPLHFYGGLTNTMALQSDSPAINASNDDTSGTGFLAPFTDQRGFDRVGRADIGAFEFGAKGQQTITFAALANKTYGDADFTISASATSREPVTFTATGNASVSQDAGVWHVHIIAMGSATITAHQAGDDNYFAAPDVAQNLTINKANATIVVTPYTVIYDGLPHTAMVTSIVGVNGETGATVGAVDVTGTTHTLAGKYTDFWSFKGTGNYNDINNASITDTIALALSTLPTNLTVNSPYTMQVTAVGRPGSSIFTLASGNLPTGIILNPNGTFRGAPTAIGQFTFTIAATNGIASGTRTYTINVNAPPTIGNLMVTQWTARYAGFTGTMTIANGSPTFAIVGTPKGLPPGMTAVLSGNTIGFTGTPTKAGTFNGSITIKDSANFQLTKKFTIKINPELTFSLAKLANYQPGKSYSQTIKTAGGTGDRIVSYTLSDPLPDGLTISPASPTSGTITIKGKTSVKTKITITMTVTDELGAHTTVKYTLQSAF
jgi:hypothetical protein